MVLGLGFEPRTNRLKVYCSTAELPERCYLKQGDDTSLRVLWQAKFYVYFIFIVICREKPTKNIILGDEYW